MPVYNYKCNCGYSGEALVKTAETSVYCPNCEGKLERQVSRFNIGGQKEQYDCQLKDNAPSIKATFDFCEEHKLPSVCLDFPCGHHLRADFLHIDRNKVVRGNPRKN